MRLRYLAEKIFFSLLLVLWVVQHHVRRLRICWYTSNNYLGEAILPQKALWLINERHCF